MGHFETGGVAHWLNSWCLSLLVGKVRLCLALYHGQCTESRPPCDDTV